MLEYNEMMSTDIPSYEAMTAPNLRLRAQAGQLRALLLELSETSAK